MVSLILYTTLFAFNIGPIAYADDQLVYVQTLSRHGARSPIKAYPADDYNETSWPQGYGQLTQHGIIQLNDVGKFLRLYYIDGKPHTFLSKSYNRKEIYVRSSDIDRTLMSAESCMDGLYPPLDSNHINPIPVHTVETNLDKELLNDGCEEYDIVLKEVLASREVETLRKLYVEFFQFVSGKTLMNLQSFENVVSITDNFICKMTNNFSLPNWTSFKIQNKTCYEHLVFIKDFYFTFRFNRRNLAKLKAGLLFSNIIDRMLRKVFNVTSSTNLTTNNANKNVTKSKFPPREQPDKAYFYFAHDTTLSGLLSTFNVFNDLCPPFASTLMIELYKYENVSSNNFTIDNVTLQDIINNVTTNRYNITDDINDYYIKLLYRNVTDNVDVKPFSLIIPGCEERCAFTKFLWLTHENAVTNWKEACLPNTNKPENTSSDNKWSFVFDKNHLMWTTLISCIISILLFIIITFYLIMKCRSYKTYRKYIDLPTEIN